MCLNQANTNETRAINANIKTFVPPVVMANLIPAATDRIPVEIQIISITSNELFLILEIYCCSNLLYSAFNKPWIGFKTGSHYYLVLICDLYKPIGIDQVFSLVPV